MAKITRSSNKMIAGVCSGIAEHFGLNTSAVRIIFAIALILSFFTFGIAYLILMIILPTSSSADTYKERMQEKLRNNR